MNPDQKKRLFDLFTGHAAEQLDPAQREELQTLLRHSKEARSLWFLHQDLEIGIQSHSKAGVPLELPRREPRAWWRALPLQIAAAILLGGLLLFGFRAAEVPVLAEMLEVHHARWASGSLPTEPGSRLASGRMHLAEGVARLRFRAGVDLILEGPAELELIGPKVCRLKQGALIARVGKSAHGFTVLTPSATVVDLGTEFSLSFDAKGQGTVRVMRGDVEVRHSDGASKLRLSTGQMAFVSPERLSPPTQLELEPQRDSPAEISVPASWEINTRLGKGAATYVYEHRALSNQSEKLLLLKHCREIGYGRKVLLRFDLSAVPSLAALREARLVFNLGPTGYGYVSRGGDAGLAVFALTREEADTWVPSELTWENQPAFDPSAGRVDETQAVRVGEVIIPSGVQTGVFELRDARLLQRIQSDTNRQLTLIVVRENRIEEEGGLVLGIAGNHHPSLPPPTLQLR